MARHPAAFINAIYEEGTKEEAVQWLQIVWDDYCDLKDKQKGLIMNDMVKQVADATHKIEADVKGMAHKGADAVKHATDKLPWHHKHDHQEDGGVAQEAPTPMQAPTPDVKN